LDEKKLILFPILKKNSFPHPNIIFQLVRLVSCNRSWCRSSAEYAWTVGKI